MFLAKVKCTDWTICRLYIPTFVCSSWLLFHWVCTTGQYMTQPESCPQYLFFPALTETSHTQQILIIRSQWQICQECIAVANLSGMYYSIVVMAGRMNTDDTVQRTCAVPENCWHHCIYNIGNCLCESGQHQWHDSELLWLSSHYHYFSILGRNWTPIQVENAVSNKIENLVLP